MTSSTAPHTFTLRSRVVYNDGRAGHSGVLGTVLKLDSVGMTVQFDDRADTTYIAFDERRWMDFIALAN